MTSTSIYIHIPFCHTICSYCDFCKINYRQEYVDTYLDSLSKEIKSRYQNEPVKTIYIGGGTPSCLSIKELTKLLELITIFNLDKEYEYTIECNIEDITLDKIKLFKKYGINRLSIGVQSFNKDIIKKLNRHHDKDLVFKNIKLLKEYFDNINIDLMYALYGQTLEDIVFDLNIISNLDIKHVSIYALIIEDNTMIKIKNIKEVDSEMQSAMYDLIRNKLEKNGFTQYEISNFALKGFESKHNLTYWNNDNYYGFGSGASGFINNINLSKKYITFNNNHIYFNQILKITNFFEKNNEN